MSALILVLLGTAQPAAAATITFTSGPPASPVTAYEPYPSHTFAATGDAAITFSLAAGSLPPGMALSSGGGFSGTPTTPGTYAFTVRATGTPSGDTADQAVTVVVKAPTITVTSDAPTSPVTAYQPYPTHTFTASGGTAPYTLSLRSGSLPPGMAVSSAGVLSGTPTTPGSYAFGIRMTDTHGFSADQDVTVVVVAPTITITSGAPTSPWYTGQSYPQHTFTASGGTAPYTLSLRSGSLPPGMAVSSAGKLSGTPTTPGSYAFGIRMTDTHGFSADQDVTVVIADPATTFTSGEPPRGAVGEEYSFRFTATGDSDIQFSVTAGDLPAGLTLAPDGVLSGTPESAGSFTFTVKATGTASSATDEVTLAVDAASSSPSSTPTSPSPDPSSTSPSATAGPGLPVTGSDTRTMLLLGVAVIAVGGMLLLVAYERRRRS
ncbi:putative Ig domain-containing protein [Micromonospora sp. MP36]|uniref:putative Ig domain-containing protein n=1 Tax=Micromonospora sp. MP36 TaxID=2604468 RepID=UPI001CA33265|nr:putative Ig domain-containing protein [Micromonospora sp. MP36]